VKTCVRVVAAVGAAALATSCGGGGSGDKAASKTAATTTGPSGPVDQTVEIRMVDLAFRPAAVTIRSGATVRFVFKNTGSFDHEAAFGDEATQQDVASGKQKRDGPYVSPKQTKDDVRRFDARGDLIIGCHVAGHYAAGMKLRLTIT
jgi:uncharacterized cupredoxin-like copper-binding protein